MDVAKSPGGAGEVILQNTKDIARHFGKRAAKQYLEREVCFLAAAAYSALGPKDACRVMFGGFEITEAMAAESARP